MTWPLALVIAVLVAAISRNLLQHQQAKLHEKEMPAPTPEPTRCAHLELEPIAAKPLTSDHALPYHQTILLKRCKACGGHSTEGHPGFWQTADFMRTKADETWLKEQVG